MGTRSIATEATRSPAGSSTHTCIISPVSIGECLFPGAGGRSLAVFRGAVLEKIRVFDGVQHVVEPRQWVARDPIQRRKTQLHQAPIGDVTNIALDAGGGQTLYRALLERQIDECVLMLDNRAADRVQLAAQTL